MPEIFYSFKKQTANTIEVIAKINDYEFRRVMNEEEFSHFKEEVLNPCKSLEGED